MSALPVDCSPPEDLELLDALPPEWDEERAPWYLRMSRAVTPVLFVTGIVYTARGRVYACTSGEHRDLASALEMVRACLWDAPHGTAWVTRFEDEGRPVNADGCLVDTLASVVDVRFYRLGDEARGRGVAHVRAANEQEFLASVGIAAAAPVGAGRA